MTIKNPLTRHVTIKRVGITTLALLALNVPAHSQTITAATNANLNDTTGLLDYSLSDASGTIGAATFSANSISLTNNSGGTTTPGATSFSVNKLSTSDLNAPANSTVTWNIGTAATPSINAGSTNTLTLATTASNTMGRMQINSTIKDGATPGSSLITSGSSRILLAANNTYTGTTTIGAGGSLQIGNNGNTGSFGTGNVINNGTITFRRSGSNYQVANAISGSGGVIINNSSVITTLTGLNSYTGLTDIQASTLGVGANNALSAGSSIRVRSGATLAMNSFTAPSSVLTLDDGGTLSFSLGTPGNSTALLSLGGNLTKGAPVTAGTYKINLSGGQIGTYKLISFSGTTFSSADNFTAVLSGGYVGSFGLNSNDLSYTISAIPEPSSAAALGGLAVLGMVAVRRRRR